MNIDEKPIVQESESLLKYLVYRQEATIKRLTWFTMSLVIVFALVIAWIIFSMETIESVVDISGNNTSSDIISEVIIR